MRHIWQIKFFIRMPVSHRVNNMGKIKNSLYLSLEKNHWISIGILAIFLVYQILGIWQYYSQRFSNEDPHRIVQLLLNNIDAGFYIAIVVHILFVLFVHILIASMLYSLWITSPIKKLKDSRLYFILYILGFLLLSVLWNRILFPASLSFESSDLLLAQVHSMKVFYALSVSYLLFFLLSIYSILEKMILNSHFRFHKAYMVTTGILVIALLINVGAGRLKPTINNLGGKPNVILIGIDSLRLDHLAYYGFKRGLTPHIDSFLEEAVVFDDTLTPIARTFPAWMSIFSGQYPSRHGSRFNLYPADIALNNTLLPSVLQQQDYLTYYMTDEVRFANFTKEYGFDVLSTPEMGVRDFAFGMSLDFIYLNMLSRIKYFSDLFPYTYANRAAKTVYYPQSFIDRTTRTVTNIKSAPFFMAVHHCLPHWPYYNHLSQDVVDKSVKKYKSKTSAPLQYLNTLYLVDKQVGNLLNRLKAKGALENSIVIMLSDHGEAFGINDDVLISENDINVPLGKGHGTFALSTGQHKVLLAMQRYKQGQAVWQAGSRKAEASLIDIMPTILSSLSVDGRKFDGVSLLPFLENHSLASNARLRFTESGLTSASVDAGNPDEAKLFKEYSNFYQITHDNLVELKTGFLPELIKTKQRAVINEDKGLMFSRTATGAQWLLADYKKRSIREIANPDNDTKNTKYLKARLCEEYKTDVGFYNQFCLVIKDE